MADLGSAYVNIVPKAPGISGKIEEVLNQGAPGADRAGASFGKRLVGSLAKIGIGAAVAGMIKQGFEAGGALQQSFGGLETIYGAAATRAKMYAQWAAEAGISANSYAEQAVSFGAALKQAYGGDTSKAFNAANKAIMDMADNAAKMGTPLESVQAAYQGFAKQNYTMLDNLKLGYGGTKEEMERLLKDAQKISGVKYDIHNLGDVYSAIHVIQGELGLTGVAATEAKTTLTGSAGAMKASWENLMGAMTTGEGLDTAMAGLTENVGAFAQNVMSMLTILAGQLPDLVLGLAQVVIDNAPDFIVAGAELIIQLVAGLVEGLQGGLGRDRLGLARHFADRADRERDQGQQRLDQAQVQRRHEKRLRRGRRDQMGGPRQEHRQRHHLRPVGRRDLALPRGARPDQQRPGRRRGGGGHRLALEGVRGPDRQMDPRGRGRGRGAEHGAAGHRHAQHGGRVPRQRGELFSSGGLRPGDERRGPDH